MVFVSACIWRHCELLSFSCLVLSWWCVMLFLKLLVYLGLNPSCCFSSVYGSTYVIVSLQSSQQEYQ